VPAAAPLSINQNTVTLGKEQLVTLVASGGKLPLTVDWFGNRPNTDQMEVVPPSGRDITVVGKSALPNGKTFTLLIRDALSAPPIEVKITTLKAGFAVLPTELTLEKGKTATIRLSNGKSPYKASWIVTAGNSAPANIKVKVTDSTVELTGESNLATGQAHTLHLSDSDVAPQMVNVMVMTK